MPCVRPVAVSFNLNDVDGQHHRGCNRTHELLLDEVDCLSDGTLITFLRQIRDGYVNRAGGQPFPSSVALVGMRNIRDYKAQIRPGGA